VDGRGKERMRRTCKEKNAERLVKISMVNIPARRKSPGHPKKWNDLIPIKRRRRRSSQSAKRHSKAPTTVAYILSSWTALRSCTYKNLQFFGTVIKQTKILVPYNVNNYVRN
jgi:hypothetical protein